MIFLLDFGSYESRFGWHRSQKLVLQFMMTCSYMLLVFIFLTELYGVYGVPAKAFENVKNQVGYCGLWCGSCIVGNGSLKEVTKRYAHLVKGYGVNEWGTKDFDSEEFMKGLTSIQNLPVCAGCLKGGGNDQCKIRPCASARKIPDCNECGSPEKCKNAEALQKVRSGALAVGMLLKTGKGDQAELIKKWTAEIRSKFPYCVIET